MRSNKKERGVERGGRGDREENAMSNVSFLSRTLRSRLPKSELEMRTRCSCNWLASGANAALAWTSHVSPPFKLYSLLEPQ